MAVSLPIPEVTPALLIKISIFPNVSIVLLTKNSTSSSLVRLAFINIEVPPFLLISSDTFSLQEISR